MRRPATGWTTNLRLGHRKWEENLEGQAKLMRSQKFAFAWSMENIEAKANNKLGMLNSVFQLKATP